MLKAWKVCLNQSLFAGSGSDLIFIQCSLDKKYPGQTFISLKVGAEDWRKGDIEIETDLLEAELENVVTTSNHVHPTAGVGHGVGGEVWGEAPVSVPDNSTASELQLDGIDLIISITT